MAIARRKSGKAVINRQNLKEAAVSDFQTNTDDFLDVLQSDFEKNKEIYGQKLSKLNAIKDYMHQEKAVYDDSEKIVNDIAKASKRPAERKPEPQAYMIDEDT